MPSTGGDVQEASSGLLYPRGPGQALVRIGTGAMICVHHAEPAFAELFMVYMLAHFGKEGEPEAIIPKVSQETLGTMIGTTRSGVSSFPSTFRNLNFIACNRGSHVHRSLLNIILHARFSYYCRSWRGSVAKLLPDQFSPPEQL